MLRSITISTFIIFNFAFTQQNRFAFLASQNGKPSALDIIKSQYIEDLKHFSTACADLHLQANQYEKQLIPLSALRRQHLDTRLAFKKVQYLLEYLDPYVVNKSINGAPLPKLEPQVPEITVIAPMGLQTIDELLFVDATNIDAREIMQLTKKLKNTVEHTIDFQSKKELQYRYIIEAARYEVIRIFTLGLTGFDTPGSVQGIAEARIATGAIKTAISQLNSVLNSRAQAHLATTLSLLDQSQDYLTEHYDFDNFDRLHFLTEYTNPLYETIYHLHRSSGIEFSEEYDRTASAHNYHSLNLFDKDFLNPSYYAEISAGDQRNQKKVALGKKLFYDKIMSKDLNMSCASCHHPEKGFTDGLAKSKSNNPSTHTLRNSPGLVNAVYSTKYFWDMREYDLERQVKHVVSDSLEFNIDFIDLADRIKADPGYYALFESTYGDQDQYIVSTWSISNALASYIASLTSFDSEVDQYIKGTIEQLDPNIRSGFNLFMGKAACGTCHFAPVFNGTVPPLFQDSESEVLGILTDYDTLSPILDEDYGRLVNGLPEEEADHYMRSFKTVTVRNAALTAPYMHNGSIENLEELMDFYNRGGGAGMGLDVPHQTLSDAPLDLSQQEIGQIISFMEALTSAPDDE